MASVQVMPNSGTLASKKEQHKEAGRKRLEEFRKKKAAAKKAASIPKQDPGDALQHEKQDSDGIGISEEVGRTIDEENPSQSTELTRKIQLNSSYGTRTSPPSSTSNYSDTVRAYTSGAVLRDSDASLGIVGNNNDPTQAEGKNDNLGIDDGTLVRIDDGVVSEQSSPFNPHSVLDIDGNSGQYNARRSEETLTNSRDEPLKDFAVSPVTSAVFGTNISSENSGSIPIQNKSSYTILPSNGPISSPYEDGKSTHNNFLVRDTGERKYSNAYNHSTSDNGLDPWSSENKSTSFSFDVGSSSSHVPRESGRRSRPSFLDSISPSSNSSVPTPSEGDKTKSSSSKFHPVNVPISSGSKNSMYSFGGTYNGDGGDLSRQGVSEISMAKKQDFFSAKQDEEFAALEQHIEDLTQEKFSLQRALEASRALAESLASENSALTDSYNNQGGVVHQLQSDMEMLQEELKAHLGELEAVKIEYGNAQLECNAADERAKLLASEVIGLEEKALRLSSNELKLERELENLQAEMSSYRKKIASLEKDRQDLQSTIHALQEEKKLLESKLRKASSSGKFVGPSKSPPNRREVSTSTEDLDDEDNRDIEPATSNVDMLSTNLDENSPSRSSLLPDGRQFTLDNLSLSISSDQIRMIQNINTLISELALEKEELVQALSDVSSQSYKLKELNNELSKKLEVQTQRLEFLTSQRMVGDYVQGKLSDSRIIHENTAYADEGDEVVERVLGWIMKLFPGGPSKRRSSKLI